MKKFIWLFLWMCPFLLEGQTIYGKWQDYFSYFYVKDILEINDKLYCATQNGLFIYDKNTEEITKISKATGLHGVKIACMAYNETYDYLFVAYQSGAFDIITPDGLEYFVDIPIDTDFQGDKAVNHITTVGDKAVFSMDFGVAVFDLPKLEFDETTYFRNGSEYFIVYESVILNNEVIALSQNGIYTHPIDDLIPNFSAWQVYLEDETFIYGTYFNGAAVMATSTEAYYTTDGVNYTPISTSGVIVDVNANEGYLTIVHPSAISQYNTNYQLVQDFPFTEGLASGYTTGNECYGGSQYSGLIKYSTGEFIVPSGPYSNTAYKLTLFEDQILVAPGGRDNSNFYQPAYNQDGYYHYKNNEWKHIPYSEITQRNVNELAINPLETSEVIGAVYAGEGNIVTEDDQFLGLINSSNSSIITHPDLGIVSVSNIFDEAGNYYSVESFVPNTINNLNIRTANGDWVSIPLLLEGAGTSHLLLDEKGWIWVGSPRTAGKLVAYDFNGTLANTSDDMQYVLKDGEGFGDLPEDERVICVAQDKVGTIWIGTSRGIRYKRNANTELENGNLDTSLIVVEYNDLPEEFLKDVLILDIAVDEANNKWISTSGGVFYVSANATETKKVFTSDNSPLPNDFITDIEIDPKTGKVYFACLDGIVSYQGDYKEASDDFGDIVVYPNPVRPHFQGNIVLKGLADNAKVKITDINGNLVFEGIAKGGAIEWNQINLQGNRVASGIYIALMLNDNNLQTATTKFAIIR